MAKNTKEKYFCTESIKQSIFINNLSLMHQSIIFIVLSCLISFSSFAQSNSSIILQVDRESQNTPPPPPPSMSVKDTGVNIPITPLAGDSTNNKASELFVKVEEMPHFVGGDAALYDFIRTNTRYPMMEKEAGIQGKVYLKFVVEKDGGVSNISVIKSASSGLEKEAIRVIQLTDHRWIPGKNAGKAVRVYFTIPFLFSLSNGNSSSQK
jgi:TonB family protein